MTIPSAVQLTEAEVDLFCAPIRKHLVRGTSGQWLLSIPLAELAADIGIAVEAILTARAVEVAAVEARVRRVLAEWESDSMMLPPSTLNLIDDVAAALSPTDGAGS